MRANPSEMLAKKRFAIISVLRFAGLAMLMTGILAINGTIDILSNIAGYGLVLIGFLCFFFVPLWLARRWRTPDE